MFRLTPWSKGYHFSILALKNNQLCKSDFVPMMYPFQSLALISSGPYFSINAYQTFVSYNKQLQIIPSPQAHYTDCCQPLTSAIQLIILYGKLRIHPIALSYSLPCSGLLLNIELRRFKDICFAWPYLMEQIPAQANSILRCKNYTISSPSYLVSRVSVIILLHAGYQYWWGGV